ncbi:hypothetical protein WJX73_003095 [Symbiochloris irregularis]|uniref:Uncharacterized protein n=1 Tax=Symbiochloris irregularis TaxID=706552 RepID=A0AAW1P590_9CHLO
MFSSERQPLTGSPDEKARRALSDLSHSLGDEESFMTGSAANQPGSRFWRELKQNWWLWGSIAFAVLLIGSLVIFKDSLYDTAAHGLPFLAVKENAAEACATQCKAEQDAAAAATRGNDAPVREAYDTCYTKCVAQETKEVAEEREKFKQSEESFEKMVEEKEGLDGDAKKKP